ncbi:MAG: hypothetical protein A2X05_13365 [Bacteroidetes bacterium GWE2_41_25]|nr:MAG: hypothetical protein A2X03_03195 [Bacteroidetes bacterium GWA2_40_15]OFX95442.1 MAG: hypothetical protein A2X05_13365 [Bacteroidetes bacterium GWE2_41_25]OFY59706.1 MAG: hypothetical protein A2X04_14635 [Bacteroidetes bacterium GWF2_41_9]
MKNLRFILGLLLGVVVSTAVFCIVSCKTEPLASSPEVINPPSSTLIKELGSFTKVYKLDVDKTQYIVVVNDHNGGVAIIQHKFLPQ